MGHDEKSLRLMIDKWLAPTPAAPVRVVRYGRANSNHGRYVLAQSWVRSLRIFFFQHDDGSWGVFPPSPKGPTMHGGSSIR
ncbi:MULTISPECIES: hypothetical protein [Paraburkholderia]|uniref:Uncharacterized protein n=1 Tax=Paraburkholderia madseniana TaxID=2599607 RepID=A0AAP5ER81_9BURK|nr:MULTISPECIES: hypothetical protein [Paraburkholderia]MCX4149985.1 hypothetical protein [Paraburkholderia madseniana]MDN7152921.1 hypothetical protein [Paraburkholderia sp. WS6]MDQ6411803.1 hypothetical protein [Paraburkholderia madseniana]